MFLGMCRSNNFLCIQNRSQNLLSSSCSPFFRFTQICSQILQLAQKKLQYIRSTHKVPISYQKSFPTSTKLTSLFTLTYTSSKKYRGCFPRMKHPRIKTQNLERGGKGCLFHPKGRMLRPIEAEQQCQAISISCWYSDGFPNDRYYV